MSLLLWPGSEKIRKNLKDKRTQTLLPDLNNEFVRKFKQRKGPSLLLYSAQREWILYAGNEQNLHSFQE